MFSRGRGRGGAGAGAGGGGGGGKVKREERGRGRSQTRSERSRVVASAAPLQTGKRSTSRSPGQSSPARARAAKTKKTRGGLGGPAASKAEDVKAEGGSEDQENKGAAKPAVRKHKFPRVNDNPDAPEVVDVPNMRSSFIAITSPCENGTSQNGTSESIEKPSPEVSTAKVTFEAAMPLLADEEKCPPGVSPTENGANNNEDFPPAAAKQKETLRSPDPKADPKADSIILIPLNDESEGGEGRNLSEVNGSRVEASEESEETDSEPGLPSKPDTEGDLLTKMIRENLNKAVNDSDDSFTDGNTDDMKQSLLNAIKNTLKSSNSSRGKSDDTDGEEVVANGSVTSHADSDLDIDEDETEPKIQDELLKTGDTIDTVDTVDAVKADLTEDQKDSELIAAAEVEIGPDEPSEPSEKSESDPLATSGDGINDLPTEVKPSENEATNAEPEEKAEDAKVAIPLSELEQGMMLVESVQIEQIEADGSAPSNLEELELGPDSNISVVVMDEAAKPKLDIDKTALFSQMNDKFAKDTHAALKNRPVYQKRSRNLPSQTEVKEEKQSSGERPSSPSSPPPKKKKLKDKTKKMKKDKEESVITDQEDDADEEEEEEADSEMEPPTLASAASTEPKSPPAAEPPQEEEKREEISADSSGDKTLPDLQPAEKPEDDSDPVPDDNNKMEVDQTDQKDQKDLEEPPAEESVKNEGDEVICDTPESREVTPEDQEEDDKDLSSSSASSTSSPDEMKSSASPTTQPICDSPSNWPDAATPPTSQSDLTKSLRKVRLAKKSPSKPSKDKDSSLEEDWSDKVEVDEEDEVDEEEEEEEERADNNSSPNKEISGGTKAGTEVFDFTDDEDIPLSNIDLDVFESGSSEGGQLMINIPEPQPTLDHELSKMSSSSSSKISPTKVAGRKFDTVSPQILSASDAMAAVSALQLSPSSMKESGGEKGEGEVMSDDTDNSARTPANFSEKGKLSGRKKRRMQESDGGEATAEFKIIRDHHFLSSSAETEDDLENNKKDIRPKRSKNHSGPLDAAGRPASAASVTSITSEDRRDLEGKQTPDSQKDDKNM